MKAQCEECGCEIADKEDGRPSGKKDGVLCQDCWEDYCDDQICFSNYLALSRLSNEFREYRRRKAVRALDDLDDTEDVGPVKVRYWDIHNRHILDLVLFFGGGIIAALALIRMLLRKDF